MTDIIQAAQAPIYTATKTEPNGSFAQAPIYTATKTIPAAKFAQSPVYTATKTIPQARFAQTVIYVVTKTNTPQPPLPWPWEPGALTSLSGIIPSYAYEQYADDDNIQAFISSYNSYAQSFLDWMNSLNLPIYTGGLISGALLDWVGAGLYGFPRPGLGQFSVDERAGVNAFPVNAAAVNSNKISRSGNSALASDDIYRRALTWNFYKGDGFVFGVEWLKRRVLRFIIGANGVSPYIDNTYDVSVSVSGSLFAVEVNTQSAALVSALSNLINSGACHTPFQCTFTVSQAA